MEMERRGMRSGDGAAAASTKKAAVVATRLSLPMATLDPPGPVSRRQPVRRLLAWKSPQHEGERRVILARKR